MADQELFDLPAPGPSKHGGSRIGSGRPPAAVNRMSRDISQYLRGKHGEAIEESFKVLHASGGVERRRAARLGGLPQVQPVGSGRVLCADVREDVPLCLSADGA